VILAFTGKKMFYFQLKIRSASKNFKNQKPIGLKLELDFMAHGIMESLIEFGLSTFTPNPHINGYCSCIL
jgi:hypothetical protein